MHSTYLIELKQRGGKWAPQCERVTAEAADEAFKQMQSMGRRLRCVKVEDGVRTVLCESKPDTRSTLVRVTASLAAAISLLERTPQAKNAAASDKMFQQMLTDYRHALEQGREALRLWPK